MLFRSEGIHGVDDPEHADGDLGRWPGQDVLQGVRNRQRRCRRRIRNRCENQQGCYHLFHHALRESFPGWENIVSFSLLKAPALTFGKFLFGVINLEFFTLTRQKTWPFFAIQNFAAAMPFVLITTLFAALLIYCFYQQKHLAKTADKQIWLYLLFALVLPFALASLVSIFVPLIPACRRGSRSCASRPLRQRRSCSSGPW